VERSSDAACVLGLGCGKSTLLRQLAGTLPHGDKKGSVLFNGQDPSDGNYKRSISFVPQSDTHIGSISPL
jgi:ABC-type multidrug transport system ATPase subunit